MCQYQSRTAAPDLSVHGTGSEFDAEANVPAAFRDLTCPVACAIVNTSREFREETENMTQGSVVWDRDRYVKRYGPFRPSWELPAEDREEKKDKCITVPIPAVHSNEKDLPDDQKDRHKEVKAADDSEFDTERREKGNLSPTV